MYRNCPLNYKLQYIDKLKPKDRGYFSFGSTLHLCTERFFGIKVPPPPTLEETLQFYENNWLSEGYESEEEEANYRAFGREILARFWEIHHVDFKMPLAVERPFIIDIEGVKLRGVIDRVDKTESGGLAILDYKTNKDLFTADYLEKDLQLTLYHIAAEQTWQLPVEKLTLYHLRSNTPCSCQPRNDIELNKARNIVLEVADSIEQGKFPAVENQFCPCDFPEHCPYYKQKYVDITAEPQALDLLRGMSIEEAIERYVTLQSQIKELQLQFDEIKDTIINFCQSKELNRIHGKENDITYKLVERSGFDEEEVKALLEPEGLWQRVVSLDSSRLKDLIDDEDTAADIKEKLENLKKVISSYPRLTAKQAKEEE